MCKRQAFFSFSWILLLLTFALVNVSETAYALPPSASCSPAGCAAGGKSGIQKFGCASSSPNGQCICHKPTTKGGAWTTSCEVGATTYSWGMGFLQNFLDPFFTLIVVTSRIIGIFLIFWGLMRLRRMGHHSMMHRLSPISTTLFFVVGAIFAGFMPYILIFSGSIFNGLPAMGQGYSGANVQLMAPCYMYPQPPSTPGFSGLMQHNLCPVLGYYRELKNNQSGFMAQPQAVIEQVIYALLLVVGVISFLRGCLFLLRLGEGNMQDGSMAKAVTHIIAGIIGINAQDFYILLGGIIPAHGTIV